MPTLSEWNRAAEGRPRALRYRGTVITVHGMNTTGKWQKDLFPCLQDSAIRGEAVDYGKILFKAILPTTPEEVSEKILDAYERLRQFPHTPSIIAHSYGTLGFARTLEYRPGLPFKYAILSGCVIRRDFNWDLFLTRERRLDGVLHERGGRD